MVAQTPVVTWSHFGCWQPASHSHVTTISVFFFTSFWPWFLVSAKNTYWVNSFNYYVIQLMTTTKKDGHIMICLMTTMACNCNSRLNYNYKSVFPHVQAGKVCCRPCQAKNFGLLGFRKRVFSSPVPALWISYTQKWGKPSISWPSIKGSKLGCAILLGEHSTMGLSGPIKICPACIDNC